MQVTGDSVSMLLIPTEDGIKIPGEEDAAVVLHVPLDHILGMEEVSDMRISLNGLMSSAVRRQGV
jgi:hypothetical protein